MNPKASSIAVVIRIADRPLAFVSRALASIRAQTFAPSHVVLVVSGGLSPWLGDYFAENPLDRNLLSLVRLPQPGAVGNRAAALNAGVAAINEGWITFLDDDDTWEPTFLERMSQLIEREASVADFGGACCRTEAVYERFENGRLVEYGREPFNPELQCLTTDLLVKDNLFTINAAIWRKTVFEIVGGFRENLPVMEDWEFNVRASRRFQLRVLPEFLARYHQRPGIGVTADANSSEKEHDRVMIILQNEWRRAGLLPPDEGFRWWLNRGLLLRRRCARLLFWLKRGRRLGRLH